MSGRVHDLITAENFAKWAEGQEWVAGCDDTGEESIIESCVIARWLQSLGFTHARMGTVDFGLDADRLNHPAPRWMQKVALKYDCSERSGPALAKIARENA